MTSSSYERAEVHRHCHFSSTLSLDGGRARVDSLDLRLSASVDRPHDRREAGPRPPDRTGPGRETLPRSGAARKRTRADVTAVQLHTTISITHNIGHVHNNITTTHYTAEPSCAMHHITFHLHAARVSHCAAQVHFVVACGMGSSPAGATERQRAGRTGHPTTHAWNGVRD